MTAPNLHVENVNPADMSDADLRAAVTLWKSIFESLTNFTVEELMQWQRNYAARDGSSAQGTRIALARWNGEPVAIGKSFARRIDAAGAGGGERIIMGLYGVGTRADLRGRGIGEVLVRRMFQRVDDGTFTQALFQTGAALRFYERVGCRRVSNRFVNSHNTADPNATPWWEPNAMVYPADVVWPKGVIDLQGPGY